MAKEEQYCCQPFDPKPWDGVEVDFGGKLFVKERLHTLFYMPLTFGATMRRLNAALTAAGAMPEAYLGLTEHKSMWVADHYVEVAKEAPGLKTVSLPGKYYAKAFEGPYSLMPAWMKEMERVMAARGKKLGRVLYFYPLCPKCAKHYGGNWTVILAQL